MSETCAPHHDGTTTALTAFICVGMTISYLPQHLRIILAKSSEGFSPWFLLLGSTSSASAMFNIIVMQWGIVKCCHVLSFGSCIESTLGIFQLFLQWFLFNLILVLYMIYYPPHLKYAAITLDTDDTGDVTPNAKTAVKSDEWSLSIILSWVVTLYILFTGFVTFLLLGTNRTPSPDTSLPERGTQIALWATFLGLLSALLAALQYLPQILHTYRRKLVGALSIKMMLIQSPGSMLMVLSLAVRPGINWTTWIPYAVAGGLQSILLIMCLFWHRRQHKLHIDDFGNPLPSESDSHPSYSSQSSDPESPIPIRRGTQLAEGEAVETDVRAEPSEETPLLVGAEGKSKGWSQWFSRR